MTGEVRACPDCEQGKHRNCVGSAWDNEADDFCPCPCAAKDHDHEAYRCPQCGMVSHNPHDKIERYCGNCHEFASL